MNRLKQLLLLVCLAQLMVILDITAVNVALPDMVAGLGIAGDDVAWTITSYSLIFGSLLLLGGRAADVIGRRRMFLTGLAVFVSASGVAALSGSAPMLFAARAAQGVGAAILSPAALSILMSTFRERTPRAHALAAWGAVGGAGAAVGILVGGLLTELVGWEAIFLINLPIGIGLGIAARRLIPVDEARPAWRGLDVRGAAVATLSLGARCSASPRPPRPAGPPPRRSGPVGQAWPVWWRSRSWSAAPRLRCSPFSASPTVALAAAS